MQLLQALFVLIREIIAVLLALVAIFSLGAGMFVALKGWDDPQWAAWALSFFPPALTVLLIGCGACYLFSECSMLVAPATWRKKLW